MSVLAKLRLAGLALVAAITLALLSFSVERIGPELAAYGNLCGPRHNDLCYKPVLKSGFPIAYLFDVPGVSVERQLGPEDKLLVGPLIFDIAIYFAICLLAFPVASHRRAKRLRS
jgi:hypothetical protein